MFKKGFTLIELIVTMSIIIILSLVSIPIYKAKVSDARLSEGYALLGVILSAQKVYYSQYGNFLNYSGAYSGNTATYTYYIPVLEIDGRQNRYFTMMNIGCWDNNAYDNRKYSFIAAISMPSEMKTSVYGGYMKLRYSITMPSEYIVQY